MILGHRERHRVAVDHVGREMHQLAGARLVHRLDDVLRTVVIDRIEEIMALGADLQRRQHLGRQVVDHVTFGERHAGDHVRPGHIAFDDRCIAIESTVVIDDVGDDDLFAICEQFLCKMTTDKAVAAEKDVFHRVYLICCYVDLGKLCGLLRLALRTVPARLGDQHGPDTDEGDPGNAPAVEVFLEEHKGKHRHGHIGQAQEGIGKRQFNLGQHVKVRRHRNDESGEPGKHPWIEQNLEDPRDHGVGGKRQQAQATSCPV
jgi:hypothetical protein